MAFPIGIRLRNIPNFDFVGKPLCSTNVIQMNSETEISREQDSESNEVKIAELTPRMSGVGVTFKVIEISDAREVISRRDGSTNQVASAVIGDESGIVTLPLWNDMIGEVEPGKVYSLTNAYTGLFRGNLRLKVGRDSTLSLSDIEIPDINMENDLSEADHGRPRHYYQGYSERSYGSRGGGHRGYSRSRRDRRRRRRPRY
jgi:ssDNA-binding replication factor A large subunit